jgi:GNAT superfamily N-acetyltransferase
MSDATEATLGGGMASIEVTRTFLQMSTPTEHKRAAPAVGSMRLERAVHPPASFYRYLYREVGRAYRWTDRLNWTDDQVRAHLARDAISLWIMYSEGSPAGYFELERHPDGSTEIAYFGLLPEFIGRGLGKVMLSEAVDRAWQTDATRVWLHTCSLDDPAALPNYLSRGFTPFKEERYVVTAAWQPGAEAHEP